MPKIFSLNKALLTFFMVVFYCSSWQLATAQSAGDIEGLGLNVESELSERVIVNPDDLNNDPHKYYRDQINSVLEGEDFESRRPVKRWRLKEKFKKDSEEADKEKTANWLIELVEFFENIGVTAANFAGVIKFLLIVLLFGICGYLLFIYRENIGHFFGHISKEKTVDPLPVEMFGLDVRKESLPEDVVASAQSLWQKGQKRDGLGLLLRGALSKLLNDYECDFQAGYTETDCCREVAGLEKKSLYPYMVNLTNGWQQLAYAHQTPASDTFNSLCLGWREAFDAR